MAKKPSEAQVVDQPARSPREDTEPEASSPRDRSPIAPSALTPSVASGSEPGRDTAAAQPDTSPGEPKGRPGTDPVSKPRTATGPAQPSRAMAPLPTQAPRRPVSVAIDVANGDADQPPSGSAVVAPGGACPDRQPEGPGADCVETSADLFEAADARHLPVSAAPSSTPEQAPSAEPDLLAPMAAAANHPARPSLFIVQITPEMAPIAKVGGLADVVFGLSRELAIRGNHVEIILPKYDNLRYDHILDLHEVYHDLWVPWYEAAIHCTVFFGFVHNRKCFFIEPHSKDDFFGRGSIYGFADDVLRYAFFSRAAIEFLWRAGKHPDIVHCHDWQTALVPVFLYEFYQRLGMTHPRVCLTIHNFAHQGLIGMELLRASGLHRPEYFFDYHRLRDNRYANALNLLKGGVVYANFVTTVSPRYAVEVKDQGHGFGLEPTLHTHQVKYGGVVNGVDYDMWNPEIDRQIPVQYGIDRIEGKYDNKRALRHRMMLADNEKPIVAFIGRLDPQKGLELVRHAIFYTLEHRGQFVLLGSSPDPRINADFWGLKRMLNDSPDCHLEIGFDEDLSHLIYAGADMMLVPSRFEPCGLTQLVALRYGTIPIVRAVGGLADTVFDKDHSSRPLHERNGYVFQDYDYTGLESALGRALACYYEYPEHFRELMKNAMRSDYSWSRPGQDYLNIYDFIRDR